MERNGNKIYWDQLTRNFGSQLSGDDKSLRFKSDFVFDELFIGMEVDNVGAKTKSTIINLTSNSIETFNKTNDQSKGINSLNWYTLEEFNRTFKRIK